MKKSGKQNKKYTRQHKKSTNIIKHLVYYTYENALDLADKAGVHVLWWLKRAIGQLVHEGSEGIGLMAVKIKLQQGRSFGDQLPGKIGKLVIQMIQSHSNPTVLA